MSVSIQHTAWQWTLQREHSRDTRLRQQRYAAAASGGALTHLEAHAIKPGSLDGLGVVLAPSLAHVGHPATNANECDMT